MNEFELICNVSFVSKEGVALSDIPYWVSRDQFVARVRELGAANERLRQVVRCVDACLKCGEWSGHDHFKDGYIQAPEYQRMRKAGDAYSAARRAVDEAGDLRDSVS